MTTQFPDINSPDVLDAMKKQDESGPPMLPWNAYGTYGARVTRLARSLPGKTPGLKIDAVILSSTNPEITIGEEVEFFLNLKPVPNYHAKTLEKQATFAKFVRIMLETPEGQPVDMKDFEALILQGRLPKEVSEALTFSFTRRKDGAPKERVDQQTREVKTIQFTADSVDYYKP